MSLARTVAHVTAWTAAIYLGLWIIAALLWPVTPSDQPLDAWKGYKSVYGNDVREVVYSLPAHCNPAPKRRLIILGSSSAQAYRPDILRAATHFDEVDNLEVGGSNISQIRQLATDVQRCFGENTLRSTTFLFVTSYILFVDDNRRWTTAYTIYEAEKIRHGLYSGAPNALKPAFEPSLMLWAIDALRPVFGLYHLEGTGHELAIRLVRAAWTHPTVDREYRKLVARKFPAKTGPATFGAEQFRQLDGLVSEIRASGAELIFIQQPAESFERQRSQIYADYVARFTAFTKERSIPVIDLSASASDSEFVNPLHARDAFWALWTRRLADKLPSVTKVQAQKRRRDMSSNMPTFPDHHSLRTVTNRLVDIWPEHAKYLAARFREDDAARRDRDELVAALVLRLMGKDLDEFCRDYRWMCEIFTEEEVHFRRTGTYRLKTFAEADRAIYSNAAYMSRYVKGILLSQIAWANHAGALDLFRTRYLSSLPERFNHLEVGPGHGLFIFFAKMAPRCATVTGWDVSPSSIAATAAALDRLGAGEGVTLVRRDVLQPTTPVGEFDSASISEVLEHLEKPATALQTLHGALRPGGSIFINVPINSPAPDHIFLWKTADEIMELITSIGFSIQEKHLLPMTGYRIEKAIKWRLSISCVIFATRG